MSGTLEEVKGRPDIVEYIQHSPEERAPEVRLDAEFSTFWGHVEYLADHTVRPVVSHGIGNVSVVGFFDDRSFGSNPLNQAALRLVPTVDWENRGSHFDPVQHYRARSLRHVVDVLRRNKTEVDALRRDEVADYLVGRELGIDEYDDSTVFRDKIGYNNNGRFGSPPYSKSPLYMLNLKSQFSDLASDLNEGSVMSIPEMAERVEEEGYKDFLDYLVHNFETVRERIGERFDELYGEAAQIS